MKTIKIISACSILILLVTLSTNAADRFWVSTVTSNWNNTANWSATSGGAGGASVPGVSDLAIFDAGGTGICNLDINVNVAGLTVAAYQKKINQGSFAVTIGSAGADFSSGTFVGGTGNITVQGNITIVGTTVFVSTSGTLSLQGDYILSGGTFNHNGGNVIFNGGFIQTISGSVLFNNLEVSVFAGKSRCNYEITSGTVLTVKGNLLISGGSKPIQLNTGTFNALGNITITNTTVDTTAGGSGEIIIKGTGNQRLRGSGIVAAGKLPNVTIDKPGGTLFLASDITLGRFATWQFIQGNIDAATLNSNLVLTRSNVISGSHTLNNVQFFPIGAVGFVIDAGTELTIAGTLKMSGLPGTGVFIENGAINAHGDILILSTGSISWGGSTIININGTADQTITGNGPPGTGKLPNIVIDKSSGTLFLADTISVGGNWTYIQGNVDALSNNSVLVFTSMFFLPPFSVDGQGISATMTFNDVMFLSSFSSLNLTGTLDVNGNLLIGDNVNVTELDAGSQDIFLAGNWENNGKLTAGTGTVIFDGNTAISGTAVSDFNNITIANSSTLTATAGNINIAGNWMDDGTFSHNNGTVTFNGNTAQTIIKASGKETFFNFTINNTGAGITLLSPADIENTLTLTDGVINTTPANILTLKDNATTTGASNAGYVSGPIIKEGDDAFTFPVGKSGNFQPVAISAPALATDAFTAEYFNAEQTFGTTLASTLSGISTCEHWVLNRVAGSSSVSVTLGWNANSCDIPGDISDVRVAGFDGNQWIDFGNGGTTGNQTAGTVMSSAGINIFVALTTGIAKKAIQFDADIPITTPDTTGGKIIFDRFGRTYSIDDIRFNSCFSNFNNIQDINAGFFELHLCLDPAAPNDPFTDPNVALVIQQVFSDISNMITPHDCGSGLATVHIQINATTGMDTGVAGTASAFYHPEEELCCGISNTPSGILHGEVWRAINTGVNNDGFADAYIDLNFFSTFFTFNADLTPGSTDPNTEIDLYSVLLHELLHALGMGSLILPNGLSRFFPPANYYSFYDTYLFTQGGTPLIDNWQCQYGANFSGTPSDLSTACNIIFNSNTALPITTFNAGALSHFDPNCGQPISSPMAPSVSKGEEKRNLFPEDIQLLTALNYNTQGSGWTVPVGIEDGFNPEGMSCTHRYTVELCTPGTDFILVNDFINNDIGTSTYTQLQFCTPNGTFSENPPNNEFTYFPATVGLVTFTYIPVSAFGICGTPTCINIEVFPCDPLGTCFQPDVCNQICNPDFIHPTCSAFCTFFPDPPPSWNFSHGTPDWFNSQPIDNLPGNPGAHIRLAAWNDGRSEGIFTNVSVIADSNYIFSYYRRRGVLALPNPMEHLFVRLFDSAVNPGIPSSWNDYSLPVVINDQLILHEENIISTTWEQVIVCFTANNNYDRIWIYAERNLGSPVNPREVYVDHIQIIEDNLTAGPDKNIACGNTTIGAIVCSVTDALNNPVTIYSWTVNGNPTNYNTSQITVNVNQTSTFLLMRDFPDNPTTVVFPIPADNCIISDEVIVIVNQPPLINVVTTNVTCNGLCNGEASVISTQNLTPPLFYLWDANANNQVTPTATGLCAGSYMVTVTDANNCVATATISITEPPPICCISVIITELQHIDNTCTGDNQGSIDISVLGATPPLTFAWSNGAITKDISNLTAGAYTVTVNDNAGCTQTATFTITDPLTTMLITPAVTNVLCFGESTGAIDLTVTGGTAPYDFNWTGPNLFTSSNKDIANLQTGSYTVTVTDAGGECIIPFPLGIPITQPPDLTITSNVTNETCTGISDGAINLIVSGGTGAYTYAWSDGAGNIQNRINLVAGTYVVTVSDENNCEKTETIVISITSTLSVTLIPPGMATACLGTGGDITAQESGGTPPYSYLWNTGNTTKWQFTNQSGVTYSVTVTDANGCTASASIVSGGVSANPVNYITCDPNCVTLTAHSGSSYLWSTGATTSSIDACQSGVYGVSIMGSAYCGGNVDIFKDVSILNCVAPDLCATLGALIWHCTCPCVAPISPQCTTCKRITIFTSVRNYGLWINSPCSLKITLPPLTQYITQCSYTSIAPDLIIDDVAGDQLFWYFNSYPQTYPAETFQIIFSIEIPYDVITCISPQILTFRSEVIPADGDLGGGCSDIAFFNLTYPGAYDPNNKIISDPIGVGICNAIQSDDIITYQINFENIGNAPATNVFVFDTIDPVKLDIFTIENIQSSHPLTSFFVGNGNTLIWSFFNINLPDSFTNPGGNMGFVKFRIKPVSNIAPLTVIENHAAIIFDSNVPVITNTVFNTIQGPAILISASDSTSFCEGQGVTLTAGTANSYLWSTGENTQSITANQTGDYSVSDPTGCYAPSDIIHIDVLPNPAVDAGNCFTVYRGYSPAECVTINAVTVSGTPPYIYLWSTGNTSSTITVCPIATTQYNITVTDANGCTGTDVVNVEIVDVRCGQNNNKISLCHLPPDDPLNAQQLCLAANAIQSHLNNHGDYLGPCGAIDPCAQAKMGGIYDIGTPNNIIELHKTPITEKPFLTSFPNPFADKTTIIFSPENDTEVILSIYNILGEKVAEIFKGNVEKGKSYKTEVAGNSFSGGIYYCALETAEKITVIKLVVIRQQ